MNALFFILCTLFIIVIQTVILPSVSFFMQCFDLMIINVLFLCLISTHYSTMLGIIMDSISGVPFSYCLFSYLWIYILVFLFRQLLFHKSIVFLLIISIVSVVIQHGLLLFSIFISSSGKSVLDLDFGLLISQIFWGFFLIPPGIWLIEFLYKKWIKMSDSLQRQWQKGRES